MRARTVNCDADVTGRADDHDMGGPAFLGLDIGGVLVDRAFHNSDRSFFGRRPLESPAVGGAFVELGALVRDTFAYRVVLISKAGPRIIARTREWLEETDFHQVTGIARQNVHFVARRSDKAPLCERLGVTHFVDDRREVLDTLASVPNRFLFTGGLGDVAPDQPSLGVAVAGSWPELACMLRMSVGNQTG
jgi:hypothetical protein